MLAWYSEVADLSESEKVRVQDLRADVYGHLAANKAIHKPAGQGSSMEISPADRPGALNRTR